MAKKNKKVISRICALAGAVLVLCASSLCVPADAYSIGNAPSDKRYADFHFVVSYVNTVTLDSGSPISYPVHNVPLPVYADSLNFGAVNPIKIAFGDLPGTQFEQFSLRDEGFRCRMIPFQGTMSSIVLDLVSPIFPDDSRLQRFGVTGGSSSGTINYHVVVEGYSFVKSATSTVYSQEMVFHREELTGKPAANNYFYLDINALQYEYDVITSIHFELTPTNGPISQLWIHNTAIDSTPVITGGIRDFNDVLDLELEIHHTTIEEVVTDFPTDWTGWLLSGVAGFLEFEIVPGFTLGGIFACLFGIIVTIFLIRLFGK